MRPFLQIVGFWCVVLVAAWVYSGADLVQPPGILAAGDPAQTSIVGRSWTQQDAHFTALAQFDVHARVLSTSHYYFDRLSAIAPVDLALGWGRMSDSAVLAGLRISQGGRFYYWQSRAAGRIPIPEDEVISHSANMHMIPASGSVKKILLDVRAGELVSVVGYLVEVRNRDGGVVRSSLTRQDSGPGACEVVWVERITRSANR